MHEAVKLVFAPMVCECWSTSVALVGEGVREKGGKRRIPGGLTMGATEELITCSSLTLPRCPSDRTTSCPVATGGGPRGDGLAGSRC